MIDCFCLCVSEIWLIVIFYRLRKRSRAMESMVEENGSAVDQLSQGSQSGDAAPVIATSVQFPNTNQQQTHHLLASTSIVQLSLPSSGTTQVYRRNSCVSLFKYILIFRHAIKFLGQFLVSNNCQLFLYQSFSLAK